MTRTANIEGSRRRAVRMDRDERVSSIINVARSCFCEFGFQGVSVADISERLGISEATIFKYFPTKRDLLNQVIEHWYGELFGDYSKDLAVIEGARDRLRYLLWKHLCVIQEYPAMCRLIFNEVRSQPGYPESPLHRMNHRYTQLLIDVVREGEASGEFRSGLPVELLRDVIYGGIEHHVWTFLYGDSELDPEVTANELTALVCGGLLSSPGETPERGQADLARLVNRLEGLVNRLEEQ